MNSNNSDIKKAKLKMVVASAAFGTIGIFRRWITVPSSVLAMARGLIGAVFLALEHVLRHRPFDTAGIKKNWLKLALTGALIGINWIALFESYNYTSVAKATLYYYTAPVFLIIASVIFLKERLSIKKFICVCFAVFGAVLVSGIFDSSEGASATDKTGFLFGITAAIMYATVMFINKTITGIEASDKTMIQIGSAGLIMLVYSLITGAFTDIQLTAASLVLILILGVFHTGFCYTLFFGSIDVLPAQTVAIFTYIDPALAVVLSALLLKEPLTLTSIIGAVLVIGSALVSEL